MQQAVISYNRTTFYRSSGRTRLKTLGEQMSKLYHVTEGTPPERKKILSGIARKGGGGTPPTHIWDFFRRHLFGRNTSASPHLLISNVIRLSPQVLQLSAGRCQPAGRGPRRGAWRQVLQTLGLRPLVWS